MAKWGKNILENLTTGMYKDSKVVYREYIQNACDQIKKAESLGILEKDEGEVRIFIDSEKRYISIEDNATGVEEEKFQSQLGDIAYSEKEQGKDLGFRGIGRLCGLAYCKKLVFTTSFQGESSKSIMEIDAAKMRSMLSSKDRYEADYVIDEVTSFKREKEEKSNHYFKVELFEINKENKDLLNDKEIIDYLSFVAPVPFKNTFIYRNKIYKHAETINHVIDEYNITVNGKNVVKNYCTYLYEGKQGQKKKYDEIFDVEFKDFEDKNGHLIAWMWYGLCEFKKAIPKECNPMWGIRLRQGNIEIGSQETIRSLFKEERGIRYFVGELYVVTSDLIPNSQRDYFNENPMRVEFENELRIFFYERLSNIYRQANKAKTSLKRIDEYEKAVREYEENKINGFTNDEEESKLVEKVKEAEKKKDEATKTISKMYSKIDQQEKTTAEDQVLNAIKRNYDKNKELTIADKELKSDVVVSTKKKTKNKYFTDNLAKLSKKERKLVSQIIAIVIKHASKEVVEEIKDEITKEYK